MRSITAVEIGADTCALASTSVQGTDVRVSAAETLDPAAFPGIEAFTAALQQARRTLKLPRRCRAVVWGLPDGTTRKDPVVGPLIEPLTRAGFKVKRVVTPCNALGALARLRISRTGGAMCWLGINRNGVAIVVIRPGKLLYSHSFAWDSNIGASGSQARLLQRYSLVAFLAPEVRRAIAAAKQKGAVVEGIVTCGNLPDLRALTMPLIEELDIEVETLDSLEGLVMTPALADRLAEVAPAIRLACAGAFARETRTVDESKRRRVRQTTRAATVLPVAAVLAALAGGYWWYVRQSHPAPIRPQAAAPRSTPPAARGPRGATPPASSTPPSSALPPPVPPSGSATPPKRDAIPPKAEATAPKQEAIPPKQTAITPKPEAAAPKPEAAAPKQTAIAPKQEAPPKPPVLSPKAGSSRNDKGPAVKPPATVPAPTSAPSSPTSAPSSPNATVGRPNATVGKPNAPVGKPNPPAARPAAPDAQAARPAPLNPPPPAADKVDAASAARSTAKLPELLKDPVPKVTAILVSADRRLATIGEDGQIIAVGDTVGRRVVVAIDDKTVLLREPSGVQIRVALGGRVIGVERSSGDGRR